MLFFFLMLALSPLYDVAMHQVRLTQSFATRDYHMMIFSKITEFYQIRLLKNTKNIGEIRFLENLLRFLEFTELRFLENLGRLVYFDYSSSVAWL